MTKKYVVVLTAQEKWWFERAVEAMDVRISEVQRRVCKDDADIYRVLIRKLTVSGLVALRNATPADWLPKPTHDGEWVYLPKGRPCAKIVVFVAGVTPKDQGFVLGCLNGDLEGKSVRKLAGTWKRVIIS